MTKKTSFIPFIFYDAFIWASFYFTVRKLLLILKVKKIIIKSLKNGPYNTKLAN